MKWNFKKELARKFVHFLSIFLLLIYFLISDFFNSKIALLILLFVLIVFLELEYLRIDLGRKISGEIPLLNKIWKYLRREKEKDKLGGDVFFLIGSILALSIFDLHVAVAAILMTTFGDLSAALIGSRFGKHYLKNLKDRAWEGIFAEFFVDLFIGAIVFFWSAFSIYQFKIWIVIFAMAFTATAVETVVYQMDDNLLIPIFSGFNGQIIMFLLNFL